MLPSSSLIALSCSSNCLLNSSLSSNLHLLYLLIQFLFFVSHAFNFYFRLIHLLHKHLLFLSHPLNIPLQAGDLFCFDNRFSQSCLKCLFDDNLLIPFIFESHILLTHLMLLFLQLDYLILEDLDFLKISAHRINYLIPWTLDIPSFGVHFIKLLNFVDVLRIYLHDEFTIFVVISQ